MFSENMNSINSFANWLISSVTPHPNPHQQHRRSHSSSNTTSNSNTSTTNSSSSGIDIVTGLGSASDEDSKGTDPSKESPRKHLKAASATMVSATTATSAVATTTTAGHGSDNNHGSKRNSVNAAAALSSSASLASSSSSGNSGSVSGLPARHSGTASVTTMSEPQRVTSAPLVIHPKDGHHHRQPSRDYIDTTEGAIEGTTMDSRNANDGGNVVKSVSEEGNATSLSFDAMFGSSSLSPSMLPEEAVEKYNLEDVIGVGGTCLVRRATCRHTQDQVAVKVFDKSSLPEEARSQLFREIQVWETSSHPNIVRLFNWCETENGIYLFCQLAPKGNMLNFITRSHPAGRLTEDEARSFFSQLIDALCYCHTVLGIVHGDVKLDNILLDENSSLKLCDFGLSRSIDNSISPPQPQISPSPQPNEFHGGTLIYSAPEQLVEDSEANPASDVWSAGVTLYAMLEGCFPFDDDFEPRLCNKILSGEYQPPLNCSKECKDLISRMLKVNVAERITIEDIKQHPWLTGNNSVDGGGNSVDESAR